MRASNVLETNVHYRRKRNRQAEPVRLPVTSSPGYFAAALASLRLSQLYFFWNFSTRPVVSTYFILPVKNGWQAEQISTEMFLRVLRVVNLLPQPQVTVHSSYLGWMLSFMARSRSS